MTKQSIQPVPTVACKTTTVNDHPSAAYHAGCLLALLQQIQDSDDNNINATYTDRYFNAASECPVRILPRLVDLAMKRNRRLFQSNRRLAVDYRTEMTRIYSRVRDHVPGRLNMHGKADFQLGYFHQMASRLPGQDRDRVRYRTKDGQAVKSKGEVAISDALFHAGIRYEYEPKVSVNDKDGKEIVMYPDFEITCNNHTLWIEFLGMLNDAGYSSRWIGKLRNYEKELQCRQWDDVVADQQVSRRTLMKVEPEDIGSDERLNHLLQKVQTWRDSIG